MNTVDTLKSLILKAENFEKKSNDFFEKANKIRKKTYDIAAKYTTKLMIKKFGIKKGDYVRGTFYLPGIHHSYKNDCKPERYVGTFEGKFAESGYCDLTSNWAEEFPKENCAIIYITALTPTKKLSKDKYYTVPLKDLLNIEKINLEIKK